MLKVLILIILAVFIDLQYKENYCFTDNLKTIKSLFHAFFIMGLCTNLSKNTLENSTKASIVIPAKQKSSLVNSNAVRFSDRDPLIARPHNKKIIIISD